MTRRALVALAMVLGGVLMVMAVSASGSCAWVLWDTGPSGTEMVWIRTSAHPSWAACQVGAVAARLMWLWNPNAPASYSCWPDTVVDPSRYP